MIEDTMSNRQDIDNLNINIIDLEKKIKDLENDLVNLKVTTDMLNDSCVTTAKLSNNCVTNEKIANNAGIELSKLENQNIKATNVTLSYANPHPYELELQEYSIPNSDLKIQRITVKMTSPLSKGRYAIVFGSFIPPAYRLKSILYQYAMNRNVSIDINLGSTAESHLVTSPHGTGTIVPPGNVSLSTSHMLCREPGDIALTLDWLGDGTPLYYLIIVGIR